MRKKKNSRIQKKRNTDSTRKYEIAGLFFFLSGIFLGMSLLGLDAGMLGDWTNDTLHFAFGVTALVPCLFLVYIGACYIYLGRGLPVTKRGILWVVLYVLFLCWLHHFYVFPGRELEVSAVLDNGGIIGGLITWGLHTLFGSGLGTSLVLFALSASGVLLMTHWSLSAGMQTLGEKTGEGVKQVQTTLKKKKIAYDEVMRQKELERLETEAPRGFLFQRKEKVDESDHQEAMDNPVMPVETPESQELAPRGNESDKRSLEEETDAAASTVETNADEPGAGDAQADDAAVGNGEIPEEEGTAPYQFPPLSLLHEGTSSLGLAEGEARGNVALLESTLRSFGVNVRITDVSVGPTVTRYELEPAPGVKVSRITNLQDDIALQLAATHIRMEAPIPGKSAIGIEVPNAKTAEVALRDVLDTPEFQKSKAKIPVALGKDIAGKTIVTDLAQMPHLLIAGSTGSGKSVCINTIIMSILYHRAPDQVKLILIDPKVVELSVYNGVPHLRIPVVTEPRKAAGALQWAVQEMEKRYQQFSEAHVRDIGGYNKLSPRQAMPFIVVIIDELADLMMAAPDSVEDSICRLAQKARAAGIHLVLATQRPSVDVITGVIKANIPSRISFAVSSQVDSRTILDMAGAEKLIGKGDMLFNPMGAQNPLRIQGAFISDEEVEAVTSFLKQETETVSAPEEDIDLDMPLEAEKAEEAEPEDELLQEAAEWILDTRKASVSMLQRRFRIGYTRAGRLMDTLERMGIVGPADGAKPRDILMTREEAEERFFSGNERS